MLTEQQIEMRRSGIGASDMSAICGLNKWRSALDVYLGKVGETKPEDIDNEPIEWGNRLESVIAEKYAEKHGVTLQASETVRHPVHTWLVGTPDRLVLNGDGQIVKGLEVKTVGLHGAFLWGEGADEIPEAYLIQCHTYMILFDRPWDLAVLIGGQEYREYHLEHDIPLEARLIQIGRDFWTHYVQQHIPPPPDASEAAGKALARLYPRNELDMAPATFEVEEWLDKLKERQATFKTAEEAYREAENHVKAAIGEHEGIEASVGRVTWKATKETARIDYRGIVDALQPSQDVIDAHTERKPGSRRFLIRWAN